MTNTNNTLSNKTKNDLVDIILRKDEVQRKSNDEIKKLTECLKDANNCASSWCDKYNKLNDLYDKDIEDYQHQLDDAVAETAYCKEQLYTFKLLSITEGLVLVIIFATFVVESLIH